MGKVFKRVVIRIDYGVPLERVMALDVSNDNEGRGKIGEKGKAKKDKGYSAAEENTKFCTVESSVNRESGMANRLMYKNRRRGNRVWRGENWY